MPSGGVLLVASDDSDVPDLELPDPRRKRIFNKRTLTNHVTGFSPSSSPLFYTLSLFCLTCSMLGVGMYAWTLAKQFDRLNVIVSELILLPARLELIENDLHRLRIEFDLRRETESPKNQSTQTVQYVHDSLSKLEGDVGEVKKNMKKMQMASSDISHRISTVEDKCLNICSFAGQNTREKQRRRVSNNGKGGDEIVFKRAEN